MNQQCECYATISDSDPRSEIWRKVCPDGHVPPVGPMLEYGTHRGSPIACYMGDPRKLSEQQRQLLARLMAEKFGLAPEHVLCELDDGILPIRNENVTVAICPLHSHLLMSSDDYNDTDDDWEDLPDDEEDEDSDDDDFW